MTRIYAPMPPYGPYWSLLGALYLLFGPSYLSSMGFSLFILGVNPQTPNVRVLLRKIPYGCSPSGWSCVCVLPSYVLSYLSWGTTSPAMGLRPIPHAALRAGAGTTSQVIGYADAYRPNTPTSCSSSTPVGFSPKGCRGRRPHPSGTASPPGGTYTRT